MNVGYNIKINLRKSSVEFHIETSHLICRAKQVTGFYMKCNTGPKWVNQIRLQIKIDYTRANPFPDNIFSSYKGIGEGIEREQRHEMG